VIGAAISFIVSTDARFHFLEVSMDSIPADLLELQARFTHWRATRKHKREPIVA
jgi:hypothetical protein